MNLLRLHLSLVGTFLSVLPESKQLFCSTTSFGYDGSPALWSQVSELSSQIKPLLPEVVDVRNFGHSNKNLTNACISFRREFILHVS